MGFGAGVCAKTDIADKAEIREHGTARISKIVYERRTRKVPSHRNASFAGAEALYRDFYVIDRSMWVRNRLTDFAHSFEVRIQRVLEIQANFLRRIANESDQSIFELALRAASRAASAVNSAAAPGGRRRKVSNS